VVLSKRERFIAVATAGCIGFLALFRVGFAPLWARNDEASDQILIASAELARAQQLVVNAPRMSQRWDEIVKAGLQSQFTEAESQTLRALEQWSREAGLSRVSFQPGRIELVPKQKEKEFQQLTMRLRGSGSMRSVSRFLWQLQTTARPMRVTDLQIKSHKDGTDDLALTVAVSTLVLAPPDKARKEASR
jgi:hypothetical protein